MALQHRAVGRSSRRCAPAAAGLAFAFAVGLGPSAGAAEPDGAEREPLEIAQAQPADPGDEEDDAAEPLPAGIEVITVKSAEAAELDVTVSQVEFDLAELSALGSQNIGDLARVTPNLEIRSLSATTPTFFIRGVGLNDFSANAAGAVAIYNDGVPINAPALQVPLLFDVEDVQILRGPQGYGDHRNASAGAIRTTARKPTGQFEASLRADYGNAPKRAWPNSDSKDIEGSLAMPIVSEWLSARGAFRLIQRDPIVKNRCGNVLDPGTGGTADQIICNETANGRDTPIPPGLPEHVNDRDRWGARALLRLKPPESEMDWVWNVHAGHLEEDAALGQVYGIDNQLAVRDPSNYTDPDVLEIYREIRLSAPGTGAQRNRRALARTLHALARNIELAEPFENDYDLVGDEHLESQGTSLRGELPLGPVRTTTITGFERYWRRRAQDFDYSPNPQIEIQAKDEAWQVSENLGFEWEPDWFSGVLRWGGYYLREELESDALFHLQLLGVQPLGTVQTYEQDTDSGGVFGEFSWDFLDDFTLDGGVRFNWERKDFEVTAEDQFRIVEGTKPAVVKEKWSATTGGIGLTYFFTRQASAYAKYTRGWKAGHIQANSLRNQLNPANENITPNPSVAEPETIDAFEIGARTRWFSDRVHVGGSAFYYRYQDYQVFVIESAAGAFPQLKIINANDARVFGAEADFALFPLRGWAPQVVEGWSVNGRFGWIESEFLDFTDTRSVPFTIAGEQQILNAVADFTGNRLPNTPQFKVSATVELPFDLGRWGTPAIRYDFNWTDDVFFDPTNGRGVADNPFFQTPLLPKYAIGQRAYALHDVRASYRLPSSKIEIAFWVRNIENKVYKTFVADTTVAFRSLQNLVGEPRTFGGSLSVLFY